MGFQDAVRYGDERGLVGVVRMSEKDLRRDVSICAIDAHDYLRPDRAHEIDRPTEVSAGFA